jgi:hypothetical protein
MKIPLGDFGHAIAQPGQAARIVPGAFDNGGAGMQKAGDAMLQVGTELLQEQRSRDLALTRAKAANAVLDREISVKTISGEISQQLADGTLHYDDAPKVYKQRVGDLAAPNMTGLDPADAENFDKGLKRADFQGEHMLVGAVAKAKQADFRTQTDGLLDKLGKQASLPGADPSKINAQADGLEEVGKLAYGAAWGKKKQDWVDANWDAHLNQRAMSAAANGDVKALTELQGQITAGDYADKLDSNRRNTIVGKIEGYRTSIIQRADAAAARAAREHERYLKNAEAEFNTFQALSDKGTILAPEYIDRAMRTTSGTPYQQGIKALAQQAQETGGIAAQPVKNQQAMLDQVDTQIAQRGRTPELDKRREQIQKVLTGSQNDLKNNGLRAGLERGVISGLAPLDTSTPEALTASIAKRLEQAGAVSTWAGKAVSPLDSNEAAGVSAMLDALPARQWSQAVATISDKLGPRFAGALAEQIDAKDKPLALAFATASSQTTGGAVEGRYTSELIKKGAIALKDGAVLKDDKKVTGWKATISQELDGVFPDERLSTAAKESAYYIAAGMAQEHGGNLSGKELKAAVRLAISSDIVERNGKKLPVPAGWSESDLEKGLRNVSPADIAKQAPDGKVLVGGVPMPVADFALTVPGQELLYAGPGRYAVVVKGRPVKNSAGQVITVKVQ